MDWRVLQAKAISLFACRLCKPHQPFYRSPKHTLGSPQATHYSYAEEPASLEGRGGAPHPVGADTGITHTPPQAGAEGVGEYAHGRRNDETQNTMHGLPLLR